jgi:uncharacterized repeat protein (TIGR01451 family)
VAGPYTNLGMVRGVSPVGPVQASDPSHYFGSDPDIYIAKTPELQTVVAGGSASFSIYVVNDGNVPLENVTVSDPSAPGCDHSIGSLPVSGSYRYECSMTVVEDLTNVARVTGTPPVGPEVSDQDSAQVDALHPEFTLAKSCVTDPVEIGASANFTIDVMNTGDVRLEVALEDAMLGVNEQGLMFGMASDCPPLSMDADPSDGCYRMEAGIIATGGSVQSVATAMAMALPDHPDVPFEPMVKSDGDSCRAAGGATRTLGFWKTHEDYTCHVFTEHLGGSIDLGWKQLASCGDVFGMFWAHPAWETDGEKRYKACSTQVHASHQLLAAILNTGLSNGSEVTSEGQLIQPVIDDLIDALAAENVSEMRRLASILADFNESGDGFAIIDDDGAIIKPADPNGARAGAHEEIADCNLTANTPLRFLLRQLNSSCGLGFELSLVLPVLMLLRRRRGLRVR